MVDSYPQQFEIEIERDKLCRYFRLQSLLGWTGVGMGIGAFFGLMSCIGAANRSNLNSVADFWLWGFLGLGCGALIGLCVGATTYGVVNHYPSKKKAHLICVSVEGAYLRIQEGFLFRRDTKSHFRSIVNYTLCQGPLMRYCGIHAIDLSTTAGIRGIPVRILAVKDAPNMRDVLSEIDRLREDQEPT
jgi:membrane protein YdbS with pleckstrin-like domain